jgi:MtN3 and saliva related transmembrane protein
MGMYVVLMIGIVCWLIYGISIKEFPLIVTNSVTIVLCLVIIGMKIAYGKNKN